MRGPPTGRSAATPGHSRFAAQRRDGVGRVAQEWTPQGAAFTTPNVGDPSVGAAAGYDRAYGYDELGRLTTVKDRTTAPAGGTVDPSTDASLACQTRSYAYDANSNRLTRTVTPAAADGVMLDHHHRQHEVVGVQHRGPGAHRLRRGRVHL